MSRPTPGIDTIPEILRWRAEHQPAHRVFTFVRDDGGAETSLTIGELFRRANALAAELWRRGARGERVLLLYPPGEDYVVAIFGCLLAGAVAVPAYPPRKNRLSARVDGISADARPRLVLTTAATAASRTGAGAADVLATDAADLPEPDRTFPDAPPPGDSLAFLQYTSGSTRRPRGVIVTHGNLQHNIRLISHGFQLRDGDEGVMWLPSYHDMGLVGGVLLPAYFGYHMVLMAPGTFLQRPIRWLEAISRHRATVAGSPNFGFDLCVARTTPEERQKLDLACWRVAFTGAEPIRAETLERFTQAFAASGFRSNAFYPCYGMAETTLIVTGGDGPGAPVVKTVSAPELTQNRVVEVPDGESHARTLVGCGHAMPDTTVVVVDPDTGRPCEPGLVGEIWVAGPSVARGYWNQPDETSRVFGAAVAGRPEGPFLRTGDLGFMAGGELFITGRLKDLLIISGRNHYPHDIEWTVERSHPALASNAGAAFSVERRGEEGLVIVQEVKRGGARDLAADEVIGAIRESVAREHDLPAHAVVLVKPLSIHKTSSGKIQRYMCRDAYLAGTLEVVARWESAALESPSGPSVVQPVRARVTAIEIERWLAAQIARVAGLEAEAIDASRPFAYYGVSSVQAVNVTAELEQYLDRSLSPTLAYDYPTIAALSEYLAGDTPAPRAGAAVVAASDATTSAEPVAVIGMACRFPGAPDVESFWRLLTEGLDAIADVPDDRRALWDPYERAVRQSGGTFPRRGGFIERIDAFDPDFFGITPREAASIDPQQRLLLEVASEAIDDAGQPLETLRGSRTGVFVGISSNDYSRLGPDDPASVDPYAGTGNALSIAANRLSYVFDLHGPSLAVDTACSSSLVAVHLACESLRSGQCSVALAGGVNLLLSPAVTATFARTGFLSPDGHCKAFDARADGYVRGEGAGVVVLKALSRALADGDRVYAVIRGSAVNNDGRTNGLTAPSGRAQQEVLRAAYASAGVAPGRVQYVEAHGTGTSLGDPIEVEALSNVLRVGREAGDTCALGSVKTNIGHLEAAAGIAGLIKTVLALTRAHIPPSLHFEQPNPHIPFDRLPLRVQRSCTPWPHDPAGRVAGVSSFGFGGTNAHVVLEEAPHAEPWSTSDGGAGRAHVLPISAANPEALHALAAAHADLLDAAAAETGEWADICYTAGGRRTHHEHRLALVAPSAAAAADALRAFVRGERSPGLVSDRVAPRRPQKCVFVYGGQGAQWWGMGRELLEEDATFRATIAECDRILGRWADWSLLDALGASEEESRLHETAIAQPAIVALQIAVTACWRRWGVTPDAVIGHSVGEVAAAQVAGALTLEDAMRLAFHRGRVMQSVAGRGRMAAVDMAAPAVERLVAQYGPAVSIAAVNSARQTVLSGESAAVETVVAALRADAVRCHELQGGYAFHSAQMSPLEAELAAVLRDLEPRSPSLRIIATASDETEAAPGFGAQYWRRQMRAPVRFAAAVERALDEGYRLFVEIGPHPVLSGAIHSSVRDRGEQAVVVPSLRRGDSDRATMLEGLAALYAQGFPVAWRQMHPGGGRLVRLPSYPWRRRRCWIDVERRTSPAPLLARSAESGHGHPLLGRRAAMAVAGTHVWENEIDGRRLPYLSDHQFQGGELVPGTAYFEIAVAAATEVFGRTPLALKNIEFRSPMFLPRDGARRTQVVLAETASDRAAFRVFSRSSQDDGSEPWILHAIGEIGPDADTHDAAGMGESEFSAIQRRCGEHLTGDEYFAELRRRGFEYGPAFRGLSELWRTTGEALGRLEIPETLRPDLSAYHLHPAILDAGAQLVVATDGQIDRPFLPFGVDRIRVHRTDGEPAWGHATFRSPAPEGAPGFVGDVRLFDGNRNLLVEAIGLRVHYVDAREVPERASPAADRAFYELRWVPSERSDSAASVATGTWLILADGGGVGERLAADLTARGGRCVLAFTGDEYARLDHDRFCIRTANADDLGRVIQTTMAPGGVPLAGAVHLWSLDAVRTEAADVASIERADRAGAGTLICLVQTLAARDARERCRLWVVTRGACSTGEQPGAVEAVQAPVWGLGRTIFQEQPQLAGALVDLDPESDAASGATRLAGEIGAADGETQLALRGSERYVARLARWRAPASAEPIRFRTDASYLLTGGLGSLGRTVARWMVDRGARRLVLLGRTPLPPRAQWSSVEAGSRVAEVIAAVRELEARGASIHLASTDTADEAGLNAFFETFTREAWPPIRGVVHAAGVVHDEILLRVNAATLESVLRAKILGSWLLHRHLQAADLDFFVLFSSAASLLGSAGQGAYAAANAFLDGLAHFRVGRGLPALSINWGPWSGGGMAGRTGVGSRLAERGIGSISPEEGLHLFGRLLGARGPQVGAMAIDWPRLAHSFSEVRRTPFFADVLKEHAAGSSSATRVDDEAGTTARDAILAANPDERLVRLEAALRDEVSKVTGLAAAGIDAHRPLNAFGIDSLMSVDLKNRLERRFDIVVPVVRLLEVPTVAGLAATVLEELQNAGDARPSDSAPTPSTGAKTATQVVVISAAGSELPLFCVHPGALDAQCYADLATALGEETPFYALQPPEFESFGDTDRELPSGVTIEAIAASSVDALRGVQPVGPYRLGGWSLGGVVAFEMAQQLEQQGDTVALLALFDAPSPASGERPTEWDDFELLSMFATYLGARRGRILTLPPNGGHPDLHSEFSRLLEHAVIAHVLPPDSTLDQVRSLFEIYKDGLRAGTRLLWRYRPRIYSRGITYFRASDELTVWRKMFPDATATWARLTAAEFEIRDVPGSHYTLFLEPHARELAARVKDYL